MKHKPKRFLALLLSVLMIVSILPVGAMADDPVAKIGDKTYTTLQAAVNAAQDGETVTLLANVELNSPIKITKGIIIDFGEYTVTGLYNTRYPQSVLHIDADGKTVTLKGNNGGVSTKDSNPGTRVATIDKGKLKIEGGVYTSMNNNTVYADNDGVSFEMTGGTINTEATVAGGNAFRKSLLIKGNVTISGGTINNNVTLNNYASAICVTASNAAVSISGGEINTKAERGFVVGVDSSAKDVKVNITGGTAKTEGARASLVDGNSSSNVTIKNVDFTAKGSYAYAVYNAGSASIEGGSFSNDNNANFATKINEVLAIDSRTSVNGKTYTKTESGYVEEVLPVAKIGEKNYYSLAEAFAAAKNDETVVLLESEVDASAVSFLANLAGKSVTIKGMGQDKTTLNWGTGLKQGANGSSIVFEDLTLDIAAGKTGTAAYTSGIEHNNSETYKNVTINGLIATQHTAVFENCTFTGPKTSTGGHTDEYLLWQYSGDLTVKNCVFEKSGSKAPVKLFANPGGALVTDIEGNEFKEFVAKDAGGKGCAIYSSNDSTNGAIYELAAKDNVYPEGAKEVSTGSNGVTAINATKNADGKILTGTLLGSSENVGKAVANVSNFTVNEDGTFSVATDPNAKEEWTKVAPGFYQNGATYGASTEFYITSKEGLLYFGQLVNEGAPTLYPAALGGPTNYQNLYMSGKTVRLLADVDLAGVDWEPIGNPKNPDGTARTDKALFYGTFDGGIYDESGNLTGKHVISNLECLRSSISGTKTYYVGLFGYVTSGAAIKNLTINNVNLLGYNNVGAVVGNAKTGTLLIENIDVTGDISIKGTYQYAACVGGIAGISSGTINNCTVSGTGTIQTDGTNSAGIVGQKNGGTVSGCEVKDTVAVSAEKGISAGIVGNVSAANVKVVENTCTGKQVSTSQSDTLIGNDVAYDASGKVVGGSFEKIPESMVGAGFTAYQQEDGSYKVQKTFVAQIGDQKFTSINDALKAVNGQTGDVVINILCGFTEELTDDYLFKKNVTITADEEVTVNLGFEYGKTLLAIIPSDGHTLTVDKNVNITNLGQLFSGYNPIDVSANDKLIVKGNAALQQLWVYGKSTAEIRPDAHVVMGYGDGMIKLRYDGTLNVTGNGIDSENRQLSGGYVSGDKDGDKVLNLKDTYMNTTWVTNSDNGSFTINLDNAVLKAESRVNLGAASTNTINMNAGSQIITGEFLNVDALNIDMTGATAAKYVIIDYTGSGTMTLADYGNAAITGGEYMLKVENNDLVAVRTAAKVVIGDTVTAYETVEEAIKAAKPGETVYILVSEIESLPISNVSGITVRGLVDKDGKPATTVKNVLSGNMSNITVENFVFAGENAMRWCYATGDSVFNNCSFEPTGQYGIHFNSGTGTATFNHCTIKGTVAVGAEISALSFNDCTFAGRGDGGYCNINIYNKAVFNNSTFTKDYTEGASRGILMLGDNDSASIEMNGCSVVGGGNIVSIYRTDHEQGVAAINATKDEDGKYTGGTFVGSKENVDKTLAPDFHPAQNEDGSYTATKCAFDQKVTDDEYVSKAPTCTEDGVYYYSCACGEMGTETFVGEGTALGGHIWGNWFVTEDSKQHKHTCERPGCDAVEVEDHTWVIKDTEDTTINCKCKFCPATKVIKKDEACVKETVVSALAAGTFSISIGGKDAGTITLEKANGGWYLKTAKGYLVRNDMTVSTSETPQVWQYSYGKFFQNVTKTESRGFFLWNILFGRKTISTDYYLTFDGAYGVNNDAKGATVVLSNTNYYVTHAKGHFVSLGDGTGTHVERCANCGEVLGTPVKCQYVDGVCKICGAEDPMITGVGMFDINVSVNTHNFLFFKLYTANVYASSKIIPIRSVEFALVDDLIFTTKNLISTRMPTDVIILITATNGAVYAYDYNVKTGAITPYDLL